jgi:hypothetical protein
LIVIKSNYNSSANKSNHLIQSHGTPDTSQYKYLQALSTSVSVIHDRSIQFYNFSTFYFKRNMDNNFTLEHRASVKLFISLQFLNLGQSAVIIGWGISPSQGRYLHKHRINADKHPCLEWDSNPRSQCSRGRRQFMP